MVLLLFHISIGINWHLPVYNLDIQHKDGFSISIDHFLNKGILLYGFSLDAGSIKGRYESNYFMNFFSPLVAFKIKVLKYFSVAVKGGGSYIERRIEQTSEKGFSFTSVYTMGFEKKLGEIPFTIYTGLTSFYDRKVGILWSIGTGFSF